MFSKGIYIYGVVVGAIAGFLISSIASDLKNERYRLGRKKVGKQYSKVNFNGKTINNNIDLN